MYHRGATACSTSGEGYRPCYPRRAWSVLSLYHLPHHQAPYRGRRSARRHRRLAEIARAPRPRPEAAARGVGGKYQVGSAERLQRAYARLRRRTIRCWGSTAQVAQFRRFSYGPDHIAMAVTVRRSRVIGAAACRLPGARNGRRQRRRSTCSRHDGRTAVPVTGHRGGIGQNSAAGRLPAAPADVGGV